MLTEAVFQVFRSFYKGIFNTHGSFGGSAIRILGTIAGTGSFLRTTYKIFLVRTLSDTMQYTVTVGHSWCSSQSINPRSCL